MLRNCLLPVDALKKTIQLDSIPFNTTSDIPALSSVIGQERAVSSIRFALEIDGSGYNVFVTGSYGTGRTTIIQDLLHKSAKALPTPSDWVFVYNFNTPDEPKALKMGAGQATKFKKRMNRLILNLAAELQKSFESKTYADQKNEIAEKIQLAKQHLYSDVEKKALTANIRIKSTSMGFATIPLVKGEEVKNKAFASLDPDLQAEINKNAAYVQKLLQQMIRSASILDRELAENLDELNEEVARFVVDNHFMDMLEMYDDCPDVINYLKDAAENIVDNVLEFSGLSAAEEQPPAPETSLPRALNKYQVNILIDNARQKGAPVIYETNPTYSNLFGRIEKRSFQGYVYTDFTMIKPGAALSANGGYLILDADQLLKHPFAYEALKRALRAKSLRIEDINSYYGYSTTVSLRPDPVPLRIKVVLIGHASVFRLLHGYDEEFRKIFKVRADFDTEVPESQSTLKKYIRFIARVVQEDNLLPVDRSGVTAILEYGYRLSEDRKKLSIRFGELVKIIREASFWAKKKRKKVVSRSEVAYAIEQKIYRHNLVEEKVHESILEKMVKIDVKKKVVGQVNGLAVYNLGDYSFGRPSRITVNTFIGARGIINIEREAKLSGKIHDKGLLVLSGYFNQKFAKTMPLSFSATITFEQSYGTIDGDSASSTELYALLSSLSGVPLHQGIAVTGSVNQKGEVQAIGGVNEKIEGFFKVCQSKGLTGEQGVIIPKANERNLLLSEPVVNAVQDGKFSIWSVAHIEEGIQILSGVKCGQIHKDGTFTKNSIFDKVQQGLVEFARSAHRFRKSLGDADKKENDEDSEEKNLTQ